MKRDLRGYDLPDDVKLSTSPKPLRGPSRGADHSAEPEYDPQKIERALKKWAR